jgi:hypothetical protein
VSAQNPVSSEHSAPIALCHFAVEPRLGDVWREGVGFRGAFADESIRLHLENVRRERGDLVGLLTVRHDERRLFTGKQSLGSHTSRSSLAKYLRERDDGYDGWSTVLEEFCAEVIAIDSEGPETVVLGGSQAVRVPQAYRLRPFMPRDAPTSIYGPSGVFKSTLGAGIAGSVQSGVPLLPGWDVERANVLILDWESSREEWEDRLVGIAAGMGIPTPQIRYRRCSRRLADMTGDLAGQVSRDHIGLLIVDSVGLAQGTSGEGGDANEATLRMMDSLRAIGTTSLLIDHMAGDNIGNDRIGPGRAYGSIYKQNLCRSNMELRREDQPAHPEATQLLLRQPNVNSGPRIAPIGLRVIHGENAITFELCDITAPDLEQHSGTSADRMRRLLRSGALEEERIAEELGISASTVRSTLRRQPSTFTRVGNRVGLVVL